MNDELRSALDQTLQAAPRPIQEVLFLHVGSHPVWEDQREVMGLAEEQLLAPVAERLPGATPLAYVGLHARTHLTGKRDSMGYLVTDRGVVAQNTVAGLFAAPEPTVTRFDSSQEPAALADQLHRLFTQGSFITKADQLASLHDGLRAVLSIVLPALQGSGALPAAAQAATTLADRIGELGLTSVLREPTADAKLFGKVATTFGVSGIRWGAVDKPFLGSPYGLVITGDGITSRDAMESPVSVTWKQVREVPAAATDKDDAFDAGGATHVIPAHASAQRDQVVVLVNELAQGRVS